MKSTIAVQFARKLSGRTNYRKRLALLKSGQPRLVIRKTLTRIILQIVDLGSSNNANNSDKVMLTVTSDMLKKLGWMHSCKNIPAAYLAGMVMGKTAVAANISRAVPDTGIQSITRGGKIFAAIKGAKDAGLDIQVSDDVVPKGEVLTGARIAGKATQGIAEDFEKLKKMIVDGQIASITGNKANNKSKGSEKHGKS